MSVTAAPRVFTVLVVDDDQDIRGLLDLRLRAAGYRTVFAADAIAAVNVARHERPDLLLLDLGLPAGDGFLVMRRLHAIPALAHMPVIVVTAKDAVLTRDDCLAAGAAAFFNKPLDMGALLEAVAETLDPTALLPRAV
jgi:CheY-like chemotaxis protein